MDRIGRMSRFAGSIAVLACALGVAWGQTGTTAAEGTPAQSGGASAQEGPQLVIENDDLLPDTYPYGPYQVRLLARGGTAPLHWRLESGAPPPGIRLEDEGLLHGQAERGGEFQFVVSVSDSGAPRLTVRKTFMIRARAAFTMEWKSKARVNGNRIEGSAEVTNTTADDIDLTFIVLAVAGNGRATAIGYQHFTLPRATLAKDLPFGDTLPRGDYEVHVDAVGEVASKRLIYRQRMQSPGNLQVMVGP